MLFLIGPSFAAGCRSGPGLPLEIDALTPLEPNRAPAPDPVGDDPYPEVLEVVSGGDGDPWWAHGRGYVQAPFADVWAATIDPDVGVDRREIDEWTVTDDPRATLDASYRVENVARDVLTVRYELWWRHERQTEDPATADGDEGDDSAPDPVVTSVTRWDKTDGTNFIDLLAGSIVLRPVEGAADVTEIELIEHLDAALRDDETIASYLRDLHASIVAAAHGEALPSW